MPARRIVLASSVVLAALSACGIPPPKGAPWWVTAPMDELRAAFPPGRATVADAQAHLGSPDYHRRPPVSPDEELVYEWSEPDAPDGYYYRYVHMKLSFTPGGTLTDLDRTAGGGDKKPFFRFRGL